jgi:hypothetical protein
MCLHQEGNTLPKTADLGKPGQQKMDYKVGEDHFKGGILRAYFPRDCTSFI